MVAHKIILYWLLYLSVIVFSAGVLLLLGLPQIAVRNDHAYLSLGLLVAYFTAEMLSGIKTVALSRLHLRATKALEWLKANKLIGLYVESDGTVVMSSNRGVPACALPSASPITQHVRAIIDKARNGRDGAPVNQRILLDAFADSLYIRTSIGDFIASRIVWVGIFATVIGVILTFWPFMQSGMSIDNMKNNAALIFAGIAVAFIPTAASFVFKIALDFNTRLIVSGTNEVIDALTMATESYIIPFLERSR